MKADKKLAFHAAGGKARTLPYFKPTTSNHVNDIIWHLEHNHMYEGH